MNLLHRVWDLYYDGFRSMTLGRTLWAVILVKLFVIFFVLKVFFFPNYIKERAREDAASFVANSLNVSEYSEYSEYSEHSEYSD